MRLVCMAIAVSATHGSTMGRRAGRAKTASHMKKPSQPACSASAARSASSRASAYVPAVEQSRAYLIACSAEGNGRALLFERTWLGKRGGGHQPEVDEAPLYVRLQELDPHTIA